MKTNKLTEIIKTTVARQLLESLPSADDFKNRVKMPPEDKLHDPTVGTTVVGATGKLPGSTVLPSGEKRQWRPITGQDEAVGSKKDSLISSIATKSGVDPDQLRTGIDVEREHAKSLGISDVREFAKIAIDHLKEVPDYYTKLKSVEQGNKTEAGGYTSKPEFDPDALPMSHAMARGKWDKLKNKKMNQRFVPNYKKWNSKSGDNWSPDIQHGYKAGYDSEDVKEVSTSAAAGPFMTPKAFVGFDKKNQRVRRKKRKR